MMEFLQFVFSATKDGAAWGMFAFSLVIIAVLCFVIKVLYQNNLAQQAQTLAALNEVKTALSNGNVILQMLANGKRGR